MPLVRHYNSTYPRIAIRLVEETSGQLRDLKPGGYEFRVRTVDLNDIAQPEPRPYPKSGRNAVPVRQFMVAK